MIPLLLALAGALAVAALSDAVLSDGIASPALWAACVAVYPLLDAAVARHAPVRARTSLQVALFLAVDAAVTHPLGWARWVCVELGWIDTELPLLGLLLVPPAVLGLTVSPFLYRRWRTSLVGFPQSYPAWLCDRVRLLAAPMLLLAGLVTVAHLVQSSDLYARACRRWPGVDYALSALALCGVFALSPHAVLLAWPAARLGPGRLRERLDLSARSVGVSLAGIHVWDERTRLSVNACALGLLPGTRRVLFTRGLLELLSEEQVAAVFAHEVAHLRCRHVPAVSAMGCALILSLPLADALAGAWMPGEAAGAAVAIYVASYCFIGLGWISRRFELEADLSAAVAAGFPVYASALGKLAAVLGPAAGRGGWRHPSVASRLDLLARAEAAPGVAGAELARCRSLRRAIACWIAIAAGGFTAAQFWLQAPVVDPSQLAAARVEALERYSSAAEAARDRSGAEAGLVWLSRDARAIADTMTRLSRQALEAVNELRASDATAAAALMERWTRTGASRSP